MEEQSTDDSIAYAYFYFDFKDSEKQIVSNFVTSLCGQLCQWLSPLPDDIKVLYKTCGRGLHRPALQRSVQLLKSLISKLGDIFLVIDPLDECPRDGRREELLQLLSHIHHFGFPNLHIITTSRPEPDVTQVLKLIQTAGENFVKSSSVNDDIAS